MAGNKKLKNSLGNEWELLKAQLASSKVSEKQIHLSKAEKITSKPPSPKAPIVQRFEEQYPPRIHHSSANANAEQYPSSRSDSVASAGDDFGLPIKEQVTFAGHSRSVTSIDVDPSGIRMATGGFDSQVRLWDFGGMDSSLRAFRVMEPCPGQQIVDIKWSGTGDRFLIATHSCSARLYDREGSLLFVFSLVARICLYF
jgi:WD40 repeat protein